MIKAELKTGVIVTADRFAELEEAERERNHLQAEQERLRRIFPWAPADEGKAKLSPVENAIYQYCRIRAVVNEQAQNYSLWFMGRYASEGYLQSELRRLHRVIEGGA